MIEKSKKKYRHYINFIINTIILIVGISLKDISFLIIGILLLGVSYYLYRQDK